MKFLKARQKKKKKKYDVFKSKISTYFNSWIKFQSSLGATQTKSDIEIASRKTVFRIGDPNDKYDRILKSFWWW